MKKKFNKKNAVVIIIILFILLLTLIGTVIYLKYVEKKEKELIKEIKSHYNKYVIVIKDTELYNKDYKKI